MYKIDTMYEAMADAILQAVATERVERWIASAAWWLGRQQIYNAADYWHRLAAKVTSALPELERAAIVSQLSKQEDALVDAAGDWPELPDALIAVIARWAPEPVEVDLAAYAASRRYTVETGGIYVGSRRILTDRASQSMIAGANAFVEARPDAVISFKSADGFVALSAPEITAIALAVGDHVQAAFAAEAAVLAAIDAGDITNTEGINAYVWPSNGPAEV